MNDNVVQFRPRPESEPEKKKRRPRRGFGQVAEMRSGRFQASYIGPDGDRHLAPVTFPTRTDAGTWLDMRHAEIVEHRWKPPAPPAESVEKFESYARRWLAQRELKPRTRAEYTRTLEAKLLPTFGRRTLRSITAAEVREWYDALDPNLRTARTHAYALMRTIMGAAASDGLVDANPVQISGAGSTKRAKRIRPATLAELRTITEAMPPRYRAMVLLASWGALRFGELTELRRRDVTLPAEDDDAPGIIRVTRAVTWPDGKPVVGTPKSEAGVRDVYVPPHIVPALRAHLLEHAAPGPDGLLFPNTEGKHMHHGSLYKVYKPARLAAGRPDLSWHGLRHTGATMAAQQGATLAELMERLGHSTVAAALKYQHAASDRQAELARRLSAMAAPPAPPAPKKGKKKGGKK